MSELTWTVQQARAIRSLQDTLLVANAGTGKTTTVVGKILWHLGLGFGVEEGTGRPLAPPPVTCDLDEVAAITFTEKAAADLKRKLREAIEGSPRPELRWDLGRASIGTIHAFCGELLREHALRFTVDPTFQVLDANESWARQDALIKELVLDRLERGHEAVRELLTEMRLEGGEHQPGAVDHVRTVMRDLRWHRARYRRWIRRPGSGAPPRLELDRETLLGDAGDRDPADERVIRLCDTLVGLAEEARRRWEGHQREENARDFDALILDLRDLLQGPDGEAALHGIRSRYRLLVIDEFQDTDFAQRDIAFAIARGVSRPQLFLVGDPKQSIYRFRGADISVWNEVEEELAEEGRVLRLSRNFRNASPIVEFVNAAAEGAVEATGEPLEAERPASRVRYDPLEPARGAQAGAGVEWQSADGGSAAERRDAEARRIATRILQLEGRMEVEDPDTGVRRPLELRDIAVLYRTRTGLEHYEAGLTRYGIAYHLAGAPHLNERQEVLDVLNALRLLRFPRDDVRAFGWLRSPFVGLRDETIGRIRLLEGGKGPLLRQAARFLAEGEMWPAPEHPAVAELERAALRRGLTTLEELRELAPRVSLDELIEELLERTGYRLHLLLMDRAEEGLANLQSLIHFAEGYRHLGIADFLDVWDRWTRRDLGIPQAPLYSKEDQVVTLTTVHQAKGLEWPVVFFVGLEKGGWQHRTHEFWSDGELGPLLCPSKPERGPWGERIVQRDRLEAEAEEARLLYVALTRARDLLVLVGPRHLGKGYGEWLEAAADGRLRVPNVSCEVEARKLSAPPDLNWLESLDMGAPPASIRRLEDPPFRWIHSATERMLEARDPETWRRRYRRGVQAAWEFAPESDRPDGLPPTARGSIIHGVLERIQALEELSEILDEAIGSVDDPHVERLLRTDGDYRQALEEEIRQVVSGEEWRWYVEGEHWRELPFVHLAGARDWRFGAMDLVRRMEEGSLVVDFKTHDVDEAGARAAAGDYRIQADIYRAAAELAGPGAVRLHFTRPNVAVCMEE